MEENLIRVSLRQKAVFVPKAMTAGPRKPLQPHTSVFVANLAKLGYGLSENLLIALDQAGDAYQVRLLEIFREVMSINKNWTPLVKNWLIPTGETLLDHIISWYTTIFQAPGTELPCGHIIPSGTFDLERYNGCPLCGTPFEAGEIEVMGQNTKLKVLSRWDEADVEGFLKDLLQSKTALDATQIDSLKLLLAVKNLPAVAIGMKETLMLVIDYMIEMGRADEAQALFRSPTDILRYLWFKHTGFLQLIEPKIIAGRKENNNSNLHAQLDQSAKAKLDAKAKLKLKYTRRDCLRVAKWLNALPLAPDKIAEMMHPKREMWVRFIRALRLAEYAKREGFEALRTLLDIFYNESYEVWQGKVDQYRLRKDMQQTLAMLQQRPGLFARSLFANMLWFGPEGPLAAFAEIIDQVPARLVFTLNMYAENYFQEGGFRTVKPLGGIAKNIPNHSLLAKYETKELLAMQKGIENLCLLAMKKRFAALPNSNKTMSIDPQLFKMPVAIGDRSDQVQDMPVALMGTRFAVEGDAVRLFLSWGVGLSAMHLDMDLSCAITYDQRNEVCSYSNLAPTGCKHGGDIQYIPEKIGTAEYIEIDLPTLRKAGARYVTFACNAYSNGELSPNLVVGWMNNQFPMHVSKTTGVAYDPSCVQHQVRIQQTLSKGLVFGILEIDKAEIVWLEMAFAGQTVHSLDLKTVKGMLSKLENKLSIGQLLKIKAEAQGLRLIDPEKDGPADEQYTMAWAVNAAAVTKLLVD